MQSCKWIKKAAAMGAIFFFAILLVKPIDVSTQFSALSGIHSILQTAVCAFEAGETNPLEA